MQPDWRNTSSPIRCKTVNGANTAEREQEQVDANPCTAQGTRWVVVDVNCASCPSPANWQATGNYRCVQSGGYNTGYQEREERNVNPNCGGETRWVDNGYHPEACNPCLNCTSRGEPYKCVNNQCEAGAKIYTSSKWNGSKYVCIYHYEYSDGSRSIDYTVLSTRTCPI